MIGINCEKWRKIESKIRKENICKNFFSIRAKHSVESETENLVQRLRNDYD